MKDTLTGRESRKPRKGAGVKGISAEHEEYDGALILEKGCLKTTPTTTN